MLPRTPRTPKTSDTTSPGGRSKNGLTMEYLLSRLETASQQIVEMQKWNEELQYVIDKNDKNISIRIDHLEDTIKSMSGKVKLQETKIEYLTYQNKQLQQLILSLPQQNNIDEALMTSSPRIKKLEEEIRLLEEQTVKMSDPLGTYIKKEGDIQEEQDREEDEDHVAQPTTNVNSPKTPREMPVKSYYDPNVITERFKKRQSIREELNRSSSNIALEDEGIVKLPSAKHRIVTGGENSVKVWDSGSTKSYLDKEFKGHHKVAWSLDRLYNGDICSASADHTIRIWDYESGSCKRFVHFLFVIC